MTPYLFLLIFPFPSRWFQAQSPAYNRFQLANEIIAAKRSSSSLMLPHLISNAKLNGLIEIPERVLRIGQEDYSIHSSFLRAVQSVPLPVINYP